VKQTVLILPCNIGKMGSLIYDYSIAKFIFFNFYAKDRKWQDLLDSNLQERFIMLLLVEIVGKQYMSKTVTEKTF